MTAFRSLLGLLLLSLSACTSTQVLNSITVTDNVSRASNMAYDPGKGLRLDVYTPLGLQNAPVVVFFHGGRWSQGNKDESEFIGNALAARGIVTVIPDFRQYPQVRFPAFMEDAAKAVKWTLDHVEIYGGSPKNVFVMGHSSGAHIAALLALNDEYLDGVGGKREALKGMIGLAGPYDFLPITAPDLRDLFGPPESFEKSQPLYYVDGRNPPMLLVHGENDETVLVKNTRSLAHAIKSANGPVETVIYAELSHTMVLAVLAPRLQGRADVMNTLVDFIQRTVEDRAPNYGVAGAPIQEPPDLPQGQALPPEPEPTAEPQELAPEALPQPIP